MNEDAYKALSLWYNLADTTSLSSVFWDTFAKAHDLGLTRLDQECRLSLTTSSTAIRLFDALIALYEICERWGLRWVPWNDGPHHTLVVSSQFHAPISTISKRWLALSVELESGVNFWYTLARDHQLHIGEIGPETSRNLQLQAETTAEDLFGCLKILHEIGQQLDVNWDLIYDQARTVSVVESATDTYPNAP